MINPSIGGTFYNQILNFGFNDIIGGLVDNGAIFKLNNAGLYIKGFRSTSTGFYNGTVDVAFERSAAGIYEINNGTAGQYRDLILRDLTTSGGKLSYGANDSAGTGYRIVRVPNA